MWEARCVLFQNGEKQNLLWAKMRRRYEQFKRRNNLFDNVVVGRRHGQMWIVMPCGD